MSTGSIMLDLQGTELSAEEIEILCHPNTGGVILFSRNYTDPDQLQALTKHIRSVRHPELLICVDQEGGRVQRFKEKFSKLPPSRKIGELYEQDKKLSVNNAELSGWLMASELLSVGIDFSFAPVLDLDTGNSQVIGSRAFHSDPNIVAELASAYIKGMRTAGMAAVGKHFPGHGHVKEDSHIEMPIDTRKYEDILMTDILPFKKLIIAGITGIMPAHVIYSDVDDNPAGFSSVWLEQILRNELEFKGAIFSDDISMVAAEVVGTPLQRVEFAIKAGCDMILVCNNRTMVVEILDNLVTNQQPVAKVRLNRMYGKHPENTYSELHQQQKWKQANKCISEFNDAIGQELNDDENLV
jgi:beta-N-acetylhexosaminidase